MYSSCDGVVCVCVTGGIAGLVISLLAKLQEYRDRGQVSQQFTFLPHSPPSVSCTQTETVVSRPLHQRASSSDTVAEAEGEEEATPG